MWNYRVDARWRQSRRYCRAIFPRASRNYPGEAWDNPVASCKYRSTVARRLFQSGHPRDNLTFFLSVQVINFPLEQDRIDVIRIRSLIWLERLYNPTNPIL